MQDHRPSRSRNSLPIVFRFAFLLCCGATLSAAVGCQEPIAGVGDSAVVATGTDQGGDPASDEGSQPVSAVSLKPAAWEEIMKAATSAGRPTVVDVWSLSCEPCLKEYPGLVRLHEEAGDRLHCISANIDFDGRRTRPPESYRERVTTFLKEKNSTLSNYLCTTANEEVYADLKIASIPAVLVFDAEGKEVARFVDAGETIGFTYEKDIIPLVRKLIAEGETPTSEE